MLHVQTQVTEKIQDNLRNGVCDFDVQIQEICAAIPDLKGDKYDGLIYTVSNHFIHACHRFLVMLSPVCKAMMIYGHTHDTFWSLY